MDGAQLRAIDVAVAREVLGYEVESDAAGELTRWRESDHAPWRAAEELPAYSSDRLAVCPIDNLSLPGCRLKGGERLDGGWSCALLLDWANPLAVELEEMADPAELVRGSGRTYELGTCDLFLRAARFWNSQPGLWPGGRWLALGVSALDRDLWLSRALDYRDALLPPIDDALVAEVVFGWEVLRSPWGDALRWRPTAAHAWRSTSDLPAFTTDLDAFRAHPAPRYPGHRVQLWGGEGDYFTALVADDVDIAAIDVLDPTEPNLVFRGRGESPPGALCDVLVRIGRFQQRLRCRRALGSFTGRRGGRPRRRR